MPGGQFLSLEGKLGGQTGDKIMKLTAKKHPTKKTSAKIASKINTWLSGVYEGIFADVMIFFSFALLSDAKAGKDGWKHLIGLYFATSDFAEVVETTAEILTDEVGWKRRMQAFKNTDDVVMGGTQRLYMADIAHNDIVLRTSRERERLAQ